MPPCCFPFLLLLGRRGLDTGELLMLPSTQFCCIGLKGSPGACCDAAVPLGWPFQLVTGPAAAMYTTYSRRS